jgi:hypothetical protein
MDGRLEFEGKLTNESNQFWKKYESKIETETQKLLSEINSLNNETKILSDKKTQLTEHQNEIVDRLQHIQLPIGEIPIGFSETMAVFPLILSGGLLILVLTLVESINHFTFYLLRKILSESYLQINKFHSHYHYG